MLLLVKQINIKLVHLIVLYNKTNQPWLGWWRHNMEWKWQSLSNCCFPELSSLQPLQVNT